MPSFDITEGVVSDLGVVASGAASWSNTDFFFDWAIAGIPFIDARSDKLPFERYTSPIRKQQFDTTQEVGEQSLEGWWLRSQSTFHGGSAMKFLDSTINGGVGRYLDQSSGAQDGRRFYASAGVDVWTPGTVTLLKSTALKKASGGTCQVVGGIQAGADCFFQLNPSGVVTREDGSSTAITGWGNNPSWISTNGQSLFGSHVTGIDSVAVTGTSTSALWTQSSGTAPRTWWVKQRLIAARAAALYELGLGGGNLDTAVPVYTHPMSGWAWTSAVDAPASILVSGYVGTQSVIYKFVLDSSGALPVLTGATVSAQLPEGELVKSMYCYLGTYLAIGTNKGVRIGIIDSGGDVTYGPLTVNSTTDVLAFTGKDRFIYAAATNGIDGNSGVYRIDLGTEISPGRYAYATDLQAHVTGSVSSVAQYGASGRLVFSVDASGSYLESATTLEPTGYLRTAFIRYGTLEPKLFKLVRVRCEPLDGNLAVSSVDRAGVESSLYTIPAGAAFEDEIGISMPREEYVALKFTFSRATDVTKGANMSSYQLKALPATDRKEMLRIPLSCEDMETDRYGIPRGGEGDGMGRFLVLRDNTQDGDAVLVQNLNTGENLLAVVEELRMQGNEPPGKKAPGDGVFIATLRTV